MTEKELRKKAMALPLNPGVYIMKNKDKKIEQCITFRKTLTSHVSDYAQESAGALMWRL